MVATVLFPSITIGGAAVVVVIECAVVPVVIAPDSVVVSTAGRVGHLKGVVVAASGGVVECWAAVSGETVEVAVVAVVGVCVLLEVNGGMDGAVEVDGMVVDVVAGVVISKMYQYIEMKKIINITHSCLCVYQPILVIAFLPNEYLKQNKTF